MKINFSCSFFIFAIVILQYSGTYDKNWGNYSDFLCRLLQLGILVFISYILLILHNLEYSFLGVSQLGVFYI
jgi:hypothetical protein